MALQSTTALANITLQASSSTVTFSGIPSIYRDLIISLSGTSPFNGQIRVRANSDSNTNYTQVMVWGDGASYGSGSGSTNGFRLQWIPVNVQYTTEATIFDYSSTDKHSTCVSRYAGGEIGMVASRWANTAAITSLTFFHEGGDLNAGTRISLYGRIA